MRAVGRFVLFWMLLLLYMGVVDAAYPAPSISLEMEGTGSPYSETGSPSFPFGAVQGNQSIQIEQGKYLMGPTSSGAPYTIMMWIKPTSTFFDTGCSNNQPLWAQQDQAIFTARNLKIINNSGVRLCLAVGSGSETNTLNMSLPAGDPVNVWVHVAGSFSHGGLMRVYVNGVETNSSSVVSVGVPRTTAGIGVDPGSPGGNDEFEGLIDDVRIWEGTVLTQAQIQEIYEEAQFISFANISSNITSITVNDTDITMAINITALTDNDLDVCWFQHNLTGSFVNESVVSCSSPYNFEVTFDINIATPSFFCGFYGANISSGYQLVSDNLCFTVRDEIMEATYSNYVAAQGNNYSRSLDYSVNAVGCADDGFFQRYIDGDLNLSAAFSCVDNAATVNSSYLATVEGLFNISFGYIEGNISDGSPTSRTGNISFIADLFNPNISLSYTVPNIFTDTINFTASQVCNDTYDDLDYNLSANSVHIGEDNFSTGFTYSNYSALINGENNVEGTCSDLFGVTAGVLTFTAFSSSILLWDELGNVPFDEQNITSAKVWFGDNATFYDFKANSRNNISFASALSGKLRVELEYSNGDIIIRYIDAAIVEGDELKICANKDNIDHFEQFIISATEKEVIIQNSFSKCYIVGDKTRFAYEDALIIRAFTTESLYVLYTIDDGSQVLLASLDGGIQTSIKLDTLEFKREGFNLNVLGESMTFEKTGIETIAIYYINQEGDNEEATLTITRLDTNQVLLSTSSFLNPNNFTLFFDYSTLSVNDSTLFMIELETTTTGGVVSSLKRYFNTTASVGVLHAGLAFIISFILTVFGMTFATARSTFSWFGVFILLMAIAVLSFAISSWYILMLMTIEIIMLVYVVIVMVQQGNAMVT